MVESTAAGTPTHTPGHDGPGPEVSVVVLAYRTTRELDQCLAALQSHKTATNFEVIVVVNGATPEVKQIVHDRRGIRVVESRSNRGFAGGCNLGASVATGRYVLFLNDDAVVNDGWLDGLLHVARTHPDAGAVASLVVDEQGRVLEFGSHLHDYNPSPLDRGLSVDEALEMPPREVAYASGCSLMIDRGLFDEIGGFNTDFYPAYFEDVDLCLRLWGAGRSVVVTPASIITHRESSSTPSVHKQIIFAMADDHFKSVWRSVPSPLPADLPRNLTNVVYFDDFAPRSASGSGFPRALDLVRSLVELGIHVRLAVHDDRFGIDVGLRHKGVVMFDGYHHSNYAEPPTAILVSRPHNLEAALAFRSKWPDVPLLYDAEARFSARMETQLEIVTNPSRRELLESALEEMLRVERLAATSANTVVTISESEAEWFRSNGASDVHVVDPFPPTCVVGERSFADRRHIVYIAGWLAGADSPNGDGLRWFLHEINPHLQRIAPGLVIDVTGNHPPDELVALAATNIRFVGEIEDFEEYLGRARATIAPIRYGAGVKLKVVDSLARGVPVVGTSIGLEGLGAQWDVGTVLEDDPVRFAEALARIALDEREWRALSGPLGDVCRAHHNDPVEQWRGILATTVSASRAKEKDG